MSVPRTLVQAVGKYRSGVASINAASAVIITTELDKFPRDAIVFANNKVEIRSGKVPSTVSSQVKEFLDWLGKQTYTKTVADHAYFDEVNPNYERRIAEMQFKISDLEREKRAMGSTIETLEKDKQTHKTESSSCMERLVTAVETIGELTLSKEQAQSSAERLNTKIAELENERRLMRCSGESARAENERLKTNLQRYEQHSLSQTDLIKKMTAAKAQAESKAAAVALENEGLKSDNARLMGENRSLKERLARPRQGKAQTSVPTSFNAVVQQFVPPIVDTAFHVLSVPVMGVCNAVISTVSDTYSGVKRAREDGDD